jgi:putative membrane protein
VPHVSRATFALTRAFAVAICLKELGKFDVSVSNALISVLGTVLGLVISFRTSTAYERYSEGRKTWTTIQLNCRTLSQNVRLRSVSMRGLSLTHALSQFWNHISNDRDANNKPAPAGASDDEAQKRVVKAQIEKKTMINLVHAYAVAVKHMLRGEPGVYYEDLYPLVCFLPRYAAPVGTAVNQGDLMPMWRASELTAEPADGKLPPLSRDPSSASIPQLRSGSPASQGGQTEKGTLFGTIRKPTKTFDPEAVLPVIESDRPLRPAQNPPKTHLYDFIPFLRLFSVIRRMFKKTASKEYATRKRSLLGHKKYVQHVESNVPLEICMFLSSYQAWLLSRGFLMPAVASGIATSINNLQDCAVNLQRIRNTPLPFAYQAHLRMSLYLYLIYFPFANLAMKWTVIPATAFTAFLFIGFLEIGQEIENPFEYDENDLDLDGFCLSIQRELAEITAHNTPMPEEYLFTRWNQPFAPADRRTAAEIVADVAHDYHVPQEGTRALQRTLLQSWFEIDDTTRKHHAAMPVPRG